jgi:hypothetical protein
MKVSKLIEQLKKMDADAEVFIPANDFGESGDLTDDFLVKDNCYRGIVNIMERL